jgi:hypothetical protein
MTLLNDLHPNELFRFMHVRGPRRAPEEVIPTYFVSNVYDGISNNEHATIQRKITTLYPTLVTRIGSPKQYKEQLADVARYKRSKEHISNPDDYASRYPELTSFLNWLDVHSSATTIEVVRRKFKDVVVKDMKAYVKSSEFKTSQCVFWDNLIAGLFSPNDAFLVTLACKYLAGLHLIETVAPEMESQKAHTQLSYIYHAKPLVPKWVFESFATGEGTPDEGVGDQRPDREGDDTLTTRFKEIHRALEEIRTLITKREEAQRQEQRRITRDLPPLPGMEQEGDAVKPNKEFAKIVAAIKSFESPYQLTLGKPSGFSATTDQLVKQFFPEEGTLNLETLLNTLLGEATAIAATLGSNNREHHVRIGDTIMSSRDICAEMIDRDACAVGPRQSFFSHGSFINSALIGDLLVTKQQLIKYDTGEVAHIEAVIEGLEKVRTHRRLDRTETTSTFERETINESERETQTTERFSMEKETANAVKEDSKTDFGVTLTAKYGKVQLESSLDLSFGNSQTQSEKTATSYSRDVTNRALFHVKERVREMQTITILHEVEETSVNKLTNNTGDHVNGVYCWVDKFYLNKIVDYGTRLMLKFSVPEPANFYIFRKMTKPQSGAVVEKPMTPSEVVGPDGNTLTSPAALTDANFAFWVAQYEVAKVTPPPQEYIYISSAFKNEYDIVQSGVPTWDSFASSIDILTGYEAVAANVTTGIFNQNNFYGQIGASTFPAPTWNTYLPMPNIRTSLGISLLSRGSGFQINVVVTAKRSEDLYTKWKLDAYDKIIEAYNRKKQTYNEWLNAQYADTTFGFNGSGNNPEINRATEREELKKRCLELFTGQRFESFDAATNGLQNVSAYPEILFREAISEGNLVTFFEQAFEWDQMTYIFDPYFWGRKWNWLAMKNLEDTSDPLFTKFLQAGYAHVMVPVRPGFENFVLMFNLIASALGCAWNFAPSIFGALGISNEFSPGINDPVYMSVTQELIAGAGLDEDTGTIIGHYVQKVPTNLVYVVPNSVAAGTPLPGLPDNSADPEIQPYI